MLTGLMFISTGTRDPNWPINGNAVYICNVIIINKKKRRNLVEFAGIDLKRDMYLRYGIFLDRA